MSTEKTRREMTRVVHPKDTITSPDATAYFVHALEPKIVERTDRKTGEKVKREQYEVTLVFDEGTDLSEISGLIERAATSTDKWPAADAGQVLKKQAARSAAGSEVNNIDSARSNGPLMAEDSPAGKYFPAFSRRVMLTSNQKPGVVVSFRKNELGRADEARKDEVYSGMRCKVRISAYTFSNEQRGVGLNLGHIMVTDATTPRLGGSTESIDDVFEADAAAPVAQQAPSKAEEGALV